MVVPEKPPYPGLRPFARDESRLFFGRDQCVDEMIVRLAERRFLAVLGSSGTGKSSLVNTGLLSGLEMGLLAGAGSRWLFAEFRPGGDCLHNLAEALLKAAAAAAKKPPPSEAEIADLKARFKLEGPRELIKWCRQGNLADGTNLLVIADQFEELFLHQDDNRREDAQALVSLLLESRWPRGTASPAAAEVPIFVSITMRSEYLGACTLLHGLAEAINEGTFLTPRMTREECEEAIVGPARVCGCDVEPVLVTRLLNDMADFAAWDVTEGEDQLSQLARRADQLPLMQHALNRMWLRARERCKTGEQIILRLADYRGLERELDDHAEWAYARVDPSVRPTIERVFRAVTQGTTVANAVRRPTQYGKLVKICGDKSDDAVAQVLAEFGPKGCQFLTSDVEQAGERLPDRASISVAHESLIRQWKRLSGWLEQEGRAAQEWQLLRARADRREFLGWRSLVDARKFRKESNSAWAERYGGGFDKVVWLIAASARRWQLWGLIAAVVVIVALGSAFEFYKQRETAAAAMLAAANAKLATIQSAQKVLDTVSDALPKGDITVNGAKFVLEVEKSVVDEQIKDFELAPRAIISLVSLGYTASDIYEELGDYASALKSAVEARDRTNLLNAYDPEVLRLKYNTTWRIADAISAQGSQSQALIEYRSAEALAEQLLKSAPGGQSRRDLMFARQKIGDMYSEQGDAERAIDQYRVVLELNEKNLEENPKSRLWRRDLANTKIRIGQALAQKNDLDGALAQYRAALDIRTALRSEERSDPIIQSNIASNYRYIADLYAQMGNFQEAASQYKEAIDTQEMLVARDPNNATYLFSRAQYYEGMGDVLHRQGELAAALEKYGYASATRATLARKDPTNPGSQFRLARVNMTTADLQTEEAKTFEDAAKRNQDFDAAITLYRDAIRILDDFRPKYDARVFDCYVRIGDILRDSGDLDAALKEYKTAYGIALGFAPSKPNDVAWQSRLATSYDRIGDVLAAQQSPREAMEQYRKALETVTELAAKNPQEPKWQSEIGSLNEKIAAQESPR